MNQKIVVTSDVCGVFVLYYRQVEFGTGNTLRSRKWKIDDVVRTPRSTEDVLTYGTVHTTENTGTVAVQYITLLPTREWYIRYIYIGIYVYNNMYCVVRTYSYVGY